MTTRRWTPRRSRSPWTGTVPRGLQRKSELLAVTWVDVVDPATVRIRLSQPFAPLAAVHADRSGMVMSPKQLDELGADFGSSEPSNFWHPGQ